MICCAPRVSTVIASEGSWKFAASNHIRRRAVNGDSGNAPQSSKLSSKRWARNGRSPAR